jgi:hypothetical protein
MTADMDSLEYFNKVLKLKDELSEQYSRLNSQAKIAEENYNCINKLFNALENKYYAEILQLRDSQSAIFKRVCSEPDLANLIENIFSLSQNNCETIAKNYPRLIENASNMHDLQLDKNSHHPKYKFFDRFIVLDIDDRAFKAKASTPEGRLFTKPFDIELVLTEIKRESDRLFKRSFNAQNFIKRLFIDYKAIISKEGKTIGDAVPIRKITTRRGKNQSGFRTDEFIIDLCKLIESKTKSTGDCVLELGQTKDTRSGMPLYGSLSVGGYVGFISFKKEI